MMRRHFDARRARHLTARPGLMVLIAVLGASACDSRPEATGVKPEPKAQAAAVPAATRRVDPDDDRSTTARTIKIELHRVATRRGPIALHRLSDGEIVLSGGLGMAIGKPEDGQMVQEAWWLGGLAPAPASEGWRIRALGGRVDHLWLTAAREGGEPAVAPYRLNIETWVPHEPPGAGAGAYYSDYTTWPENQTIALRVGPGDEVGLVVLDDEGARGAGPKLEAAGFAGAPRPTKIAGLKSGELFAAVSSEAVPGLLRWGPGEDTGSFAPLPVFESRAPRQLAALVEGAEHEVLVGDGVEVDEAMVPYVARFDGTSWRLLDPPPVAGTVVSLAEGAGPTIWAVVDEAGPSDSLWRLHAPSDWNLWERVELPALTLAEAAEDSWYWDTAAGTWAVEAGGPAAAATAYTPSPAQLGLDARGALWLAANLLLPDGTPSPRWTVLRTTPAPTPLAMYDDGQIFAAQEDLKPRRNPRAGDATCPQVYVSLYTVSEDSPEVGTPELRAALTGPLAPLLLGEVRTGRERQVGLLLSAGEYETHRGAIAGLTSKLRYKSRASCGHPPLLRGFRAG